MWVVWAAQSPGREGNTVGVLHWLPNGAAFTGSVDMDLGTLFHPIGCQGGKRTRSPRRRGGGRAEDAGKAETPGAISRAHKVGAAGQDEGRHPEEGLEGSVFTQMWRFRNITSWV